MTFLTHLEDATIQRLVEGELAQQGASAQAEGRAASGKLAQQGASAQADEAEANAAKRHNEDCARCRRRSREISALFTALAARRVAPEPPADFLAAVMARVDREPGLVVHPIRGRVVLRAVAAGLATAVAGGALVSAGGADGLLPGADVATTFTALVGNAGLLATVAKAAAPILAGAALASAAVLAPIFVRAIRAVRPAPSRATARTS